MAITSNRIAAQSMVITGRTDPAEGVAQQERAAAFQAEAKALREHLREHQATRDPAPVMAADKARPEARPEPLKMPTSTIGTASGR